jgi:hypothetical protein
MLSGGMCAVGFVRFLAPALLLIASACSDSNAITVNLPQAHHGLHYDTPATIGAVVTMPARELTREDGAAAEVLPKYPEWPSGVLLVVAREKVGILLRRLDAFLIEDVLVGGASGRLAFVLGHGGAPAN